MFPLIARAAETSPDAEALVGDGAAVTYGELDLAARRVASGLRAARLDRIGIVEPDAFRVLALLAAGSLTGVEMCLYPPVDSPEEIADLASRLDHDVLVTDRQDLDRPTLAFADLADHRPTEPDPPARQPVLILTTGTTGRPRAARHDWNRLLARSSSSPPEPDQRWLLAYGVHQFAGFQILIHVASVGATLVDPGLRRPRQGLRAMRRHRATHASATPTFWRFLLAELRSDGGPVPELRQITLGGEAVPEAALEELRAVFPAAQVSQVYAANEFGPTGSVRDGRNGLPVGVLDRDDDADVALKIVDGELWVRSRVGMLGYYGEDPIPDPDGWRPTGDLVEVTGDRIRFQGRTAEIINVGGVKVHPLPIEERIAAVPGVALARVYGRENALTGAIVAADIVLAGGADVEHARGRVRDACADLPAASRPRSIRVVDDLATHGHKILRRTHG